MNEFDKEMARLRHRLSELQRRKTKPKRQKVKSTRPKGRPRIDSERIELAKELAQTRPLPLVALKLNIGLKTLYRYGIKRKILDAEKELKSRCDSPDELSPGTITD